MPKHQRAMVHRLAVKVGLRTSSTGKEPARFIVITKPSGLPNRPPEVIKQLLWNATRPSGRRDGWGKSGAGPTGDKFKDKGKQKSGASQWAMPGEIVGASAPEIGAGNLGHALLTKMGWTAGKALGSGEGGILKPVEQVVRPTRFGLG